MPPVCKFWQQGTCKYGDKCRFDHPRGGGGGQPASNNRYAVLNSDSPGHGAGRASSSIRHEHPYHLDRELIKTDLASEKPIWILSAYGPGRGAPLQLFGGYPREQSFEELRLRYYELASAGNQQQAVQEEQQLVANAEQQIRGALNDINGAIKYIVAGEKQHPNRIDICEGRGPIPNQAQTASTNQPASTAFGQAPSFGQSSAPAQPATTFGQPSLFGRPTTSFGQATQLGAASNAFSTSTPAFGAQAAFGVQPAPAFGQSASLGAQTAPAFGQATSLGAQPTPAFGQPATIGTQPTPAFGQPAAFGQTPPSAPAFGQPSNPTPFGQAPNTFAKAQTPAFGQPTPPTGFANQTVPAFGGGFGNQPAPAPAPSNPFGRQPPSQPSSFGNPSAHTSSPFSQPQAPAQAKPSPFSQPAQGPGPSAPSTGATRKDASGRLTVWHGRPISYVDNEPCFKRPDGLWEKVWFPDGTPGWNKEIEVPEGWWTEEVQEQYRYAREHGAWKDGKMPDVMPKREWISWDF
ncbi:hypothetical protein MMC11_008902 [Xylographa trunciseda]|nr:hypothetical protein [Xylographa trunciseda]